MPKYIKPTPVSATIEPIITKTTPKIVASLPMALKPKNNKNGAKNSSGNVIAIIFIPFLNFLLSLLILVFNFCCCSFLDKFIAFIMCFKGI